MTFRIGMFDSGVGGLTVLREAQKIMPNESYVYFGDTARCPYGPKSDSTIIRYAIENSIFLIEHDIDLLVVACNTASALALNKLKELFQVPIISVVEPAVREACCVTRSGRIGIIGTVATVGSCVYQTEIKAIVPHAYVSAKACPLFVPFIEDGFSNQSILRLVVEEYLLPLKSENIDTLILACTHYPLIQHLIEEVMGPDVTIINPAHETAKMAKMALKKRSQTGPQQLSFFVSDDPEKFKRVGERFLGHSLLNVVKKSSD